MRVLVTGATGYVGGQLLPALLAAGHEVRAMARNPAKAELPAGVEVVKGDVLSGDGLAEALDGVDVAYYLVHSMGGDGGFAERDRRGAHTFGEAAKGVARVVYLGGLEGEDAPSEHLRSRHEVAGILREHVRELVYVRAAMVLGTGSESYVIMSKLVDRLPAMITPRWVDTRTQPVAIRDVVAALAALADREDAPAEVQLGGADVLTYRQMMRRYAVLSGRRPRPMISVPFFSPGLSSLWVVLVSGVDRGVAVPLVHGLSAEMVVREPPPPGINDAPLGFDDAVREALDA
ncbi:MAG: NAD-dependent epimerase/dehydratase family protein [Solirubrobacterales bacterium]|nr:NAD-dependent epimerase/dehydratase family protein [Solirubrobacterales bacterium]